MRIPDLFSNLPESTTLGLDWNAEQDKATVVICRQEVDGSLTVLFVGELRSASIQAGEPVLGK